MQELRVKMEKNPYNGGWLCWIPGTAYAWGLDNKRDATTFCKKVNASLDEGKLYFDENGRLLNKES